MSVNHASAFDDQSLAGVVHSEDVITLKNELDLFVGGPVLVFTWKSNDGWSIQFVSKNVESILGYRPDEMLSEGFYFADLIHADDLEPIRQRVNKHLDLRATHWEGRYRVRLRSGEYHWFYDYTRPEYDSDGRVKAMHGYLLDQTELIEAQQALTNSEERWRGVLEATGQGVWDWNAQTNKVYYSPIWKSMLMYDEDEIGDDIMEWESRLHPEDREQTFSDLNKHLAGETPIYENVHRVRCKNGRYKWILDRGRVISFDREGRPLRVIGTHTDVDEAYMNQQRLERLSENVPGIIYQFMLSPDGSSSFPYSSPGVEAILGLTPEELVEDASPLFDRLHKDDYQELMDSIAQSAQNLTRWEQEFRIASNDGNIRWLGAISTPQKLDDGSILWCGHVHDITDRKQQEIACKLADSALQVSEARLKKAQAIGRMGSWECDWARMSMTWSDELYRILEWDQDRVTPSPEAFLQRVFEDDRELVGAALSGEQKLKGHSFEFRLLMNDGRMKWMKATIETEFSEDSTPLVSHGTVQDITYSKLNEMALEEAKQEAEQANMAKSEFLSSMSHELRTPLNSVLGFTQLLEMDEQLSDSQRDCLAEISKAGKHLLKLVNDVLDLSKIEAGHVNLNMEPVDVCELIQECVALVQPMAVKKQIQISCEENGSLVVQADVSRLKQVFLNLLSNAIKYNRPQGTVEINGDCQNGGILLQFVDSGYGLDETKADQLFKPFSRLGQEGGNIEGTGVGLSISKTLVECMNGRIEYQPGAEEGSCFSVYLPFDQEDTSPFSETMGGGGPDLPSLHDRQKRVLYIEDNPANIKLVSQIMEMLEQVALQTAHEPNLAMMMVKAHRPDLILMDINLPEMNGFELLKRLKNEFDLEGIPVLAVSANAMQSDVERAKKVGFDDYITKPFGVQTFLNIVGRYL